MPRIVLFVEQRNKCLRPLLDSPKGGLNIGILPYFMRRSLVHAFGIYVSRYFVVAVIEANRSTVAMLSKRGRGSNIC